MGADGTADLPIHWPDMHCLHLFPMTPLRAFIMLASNNPSVVTIIDANVSRKAGWAGRKVANHAGIAQPESC
jgi:hypothetical protein